MWRRYVFAPLVAILAVVALSAAASCDTFESQSSPSTDDAATTPDAPPAPPLPESAAPRPLVPPPCAAAVFRPRGAESCTVGEPFVRTCRLEELEPTVSVSFDDTEERAVTVPLTDAAGFVSRPQLWRRAAEGFARVPDRVVAAASYASLSRDGSKLFVDEEPAGAPVRVAEVNWTSGGVSSFIPVFALPGFFVRHPMVLASDALRYVTVFPSPVGSGPIRIREMSGTDAGVEVSLLDAGITVSIGAATTNVSESELFFFSEQDGFRSRRVHRAIRDGGRWAAEGDSVFPASSDAGAGGWQPQWLSADACRLVVTNVVTFQVVLLSRR